MEREFRMLSAVMQLVCGFQSQLARASRRLSIPLAAMLILGFFSRPTLGQSYLTSTGMPSFGTPQPVELGQVDAASGNLHLSIPLGSYPQRGTGQPEPITLEYDSNIWTAYSVGYTLQWEPNNGPAYFSEGGWYLSYLLSASTIPTQSSGCTQDVPWMDQSGSSHSFHLNTSTNGSNCPLESDAFATDSSGYHMFVWLSGSPSGYAQYMKIYAPDGTLVNSGPPIVDSNGNKLISEDSNGNYLSFPSSNPYAVLDTLGREIASDDGPDVTVSTSQGTAQYQLTYATINVQTKFQQTGVTEYSGQLYVIRSLTLPDAAHSTYNFTYDCDQSSGNPACNSPAGQSAYYGELTGVTLPTGGTVSYTYQTFSDAYKNKNRWVQSHSSASGYWSYAPSTSSNCSPTQYGASCQQQTTVSSPTGQTVYTYQLNNGAWPTTIVQKDLSGTVLSTVTNTWDFSQPCVLHNCYGNSFIRLLSEQTTIPTSGGNLKKQTQYSYDSPQTGNKTAIKEWRYIPSGNSFSSVPDRATYMSYLSYTGINNANYTASNNINRPLSVTLCNNSGSDSACPGGGSRFSQTLNTYDANGLTGINGVAQHDDANFGAGYTTRGNPTSVSHWVSGSTYLTTSYSYDTTGQVLTATDQALNARYYCYGSITPNCPAGESYVKDSGNNTTPSTYTPGQPTNASVTSITDPIGTQYFSYYWGSGKMAIATDYNNQLSYSHYQDGLDRQTEQLDPIGWSLATYSSTTQSDMYTAVGDNSPPTPPANCSSCQHTQTILDQWGRTASQILVNNPIGQVNVDSTYDYAGRLATQSHPYSGSGDPNHVFETFGYDALNRQTSATHPDGQSTRTAYGANVTGLGGITAQVGSASTYGYGYPQIAVDEAGNQQQQWLDGFGNIIEVDEPSADTATLGTGSISTYYGSQQQACLTGGVCFWAYDYGTVSVTVSGQTFTANYNQYDSGASSLASQLNASGIVSAARNGTNIALTASVPGANPQITGSCVSQFYQPGVQAHFTCPSPSVSGISGGTGGVSVSPFVTNYTYDAGGRLTHVIQGAQTRTFSYDGIGRKIYENTPEGGSVTYAYTTSGGLCSGDPSSVCQRTDARGVVSSYTYDHANRLTGVAYSVPGGVSPMPNVCTTAPNGTLANICNYYDQGGAAAYAIGRLTEMIDPSGRENYSHDRDGRMIQLLKVINGQTYSIGYQYDTGGDVKQITYPSGRVVQQAYNNVGQLCEIAPTASGCGDSTYYAGGYQYNAPGKLLGFNYGNGMAGTFNYSPDRVQLTSLAYTGNSTYLSMQYSYQQNSSYSPPCPTGTATNNGSVQCITDNVDSGRSMSYGYDPLRRMTSATSSGSWAFPQWGLSESYDQFGNRWSQTVTVGNGPQTNLNFPARNEPAGYIYDASGNLTMEPLSPPNYMTYDGENRMTAFSGNGGAGNYTYDGNGLRVVKSAQGTTTVSIFSGSSVIAEYDNGATPGLPSREYIYNPAGEATTSLLAMIAGGATTYYHQDHLSVRLTTDGNGNPLTQEGHFPFGELWYQSGPGNKWLFTSYDRDSESGLDYALARYYDSRTGTFCSADPLAGDPSDPQSWNRYPYGRNDPIDVTDPSGQHWWNWVLDIGIGAAVGWLAPELLPSVFGDAAAGTTVSDIAVTTSTSMTETGSVIGISSGASVTVSAGIDPLATGLFGAGIGAEVKAAKTPQQPKVKNLNCQGNAQYSAVGPNQAQGDGALHSDNPNSPSIDGGTQNTVAVKRGFLGLTRAQLRQYGTQIGITPSDNGMIAGSGGPSASSFSVSDLGDRNVQNAPGVRFDLYRFSSQAQALQFGLRRFNTNIKLNNAPKNAHCPPGWSAVK